MLNPKPEINTSTGIYCIFGNPVKHSLSPAMQNAAFKALSLNAIYIAFEIENIKNAIQAMKTLNIRGASITIPFKSEVLKYIDETDRAAKEIGSVNTLYNDNGKIRGYNTDGRGAVQALLNNRVRIKNSNILILGNGGSARAVAFSLSDEGARVIIAGRNRDRIKMLVNDLRKKWERTGFAIIKELDNDLMQHADVIINTTSAGMSPATDEIPIDEKLIQKKHTVFDIVYSPHMTKLLRVSKDKGCRTIHGIEMLVNQGAMQFEIWTGEKAPVAVMEKAVKKYLK